MQFCFPLTPPVSALLDRACQLVRTCSYRFVEPELIFVALWQEARENVENIFSGLSIQNPKDFVSTVGAAVNHLPHSSETYTSPSLSPAANKVLEDASRLVQEERLGEKITVESLFCAFRLSDNSIAAAFDDFSITEQMLREYLRSTVRQGSGNAPPENRQRPSSAALRQGVGARERVSPARSEILLEFSTDLREDVSQGKFPRPLSRGGSLSSLMQIITCEGKNNVLIVGEHGVGKNSLVVELAYRLSDVLPYADYSEDQLYAIKTAALQTRLSESGDASATLKKLLDAAREQHNVILYFNDMNAIFSSANPRLQESSMAVLRQALDMGGIRIIGCVTPDEHRKLVARNDLFKYNFKTLKLEEPSIEESVEIVQNHLHDLEVSHGVSIHLPAVALAVQLAKRYIPDRKLPEIALDVLDAAAAHARIHNGRIPEVLRDLRVKTGQCGLHDSDDRIDDGDAAEVRNRLQRYEAEWNEYLTYSSLLSVLQRDFSNTTCNNHQVNSSELNHQIGELINGIKRYIDTEITMDLTPEQVVADEDNVRSIISEWSGIPVQKVSEDETRKLTELPSVLERKVIGQTQAVSAVCDTIVRNKLGMSDARRPIGSFLFLGTTGVGKTELSKALAAYLFDNSDAMIRIDMSEYQQSHSVSRLFGAPPGYVGYDQGGQLTDAVYRKPYSVVLFDEIEKAHPKVFETLLQVLDEGHMTDGQGKKINFKNTIIIMTSNLGGENIVRNLTGREYTETDIQETKNQILELLKATVAPEFINRIDEIIMFNPLTKQAIKEIVVKQMRELQDRYHESNMAIEYSDAVIDHLAAIAYQPEFGARPVKRAINKSVIDAISREIINATIDRSRKICLDVQENGKLSVSNVQQ